MSIIGFRGPYRFLSNFHPTPNLSLLSYRWPTAEHAYQAMKTEDVVAQSHICRAKTPGEAKRLGRCVAMRSGWLEMRLNVMRLVVDFKFQDPTLRALLLETANIQLVEWNVWQDTFWGVCRGIGENNLGKILMETRQKIREGT